MPSNNPPTAHANSPTRISRDRVVQFSIFLRNKVGAFLHVVKLLREHHIHVLGTTVEPSADTAIVRVVVSDPEAVEGIFHSHSIPYATWPLVVVELKEATHFSVVLTALLAVTLMLVARQGFGEFAAAARQPVWLWTGALMSLVIVLAITVAGSRIGVIATISILLAGQFAAGAAIDRWGLFGADRIAVGWSRVVGIVLLAIGAGLTLKR